MPGVFCPLFGFCLCIFCVRRHAPLDREDERIVHYLLVELLLPSFWLEISSTHSCCSLVLFVFVFCTNCLYVYLFGFGYSPPGGHSQPGHGGGLKVFSW